MQMVQSVKFGCWSSWGGKSTLVVHEMAHLVFTASKRLRHPSEVCHLFALPQHAPLWSLVKETGWGPQEGTRTMSGFHGHCLLAAASIIHM